MTSGVCHCDPWYVLCCVIVILVCADVTTEVRLDPSPQQS